MKKTNDLKQTLINANDELLSVEDVAEILRIKPSSVRKKAERGQLPYYKKPLSKRLWFSKVELMGVIKNDIESK